ncbi:MAG: urate hydroxylase PuuD [Rhodospirillaceae bacterium]|nr:urate hydroxylase PuuD [Rhodospirillaceae bacterium]MBT5941269.1 urate hydroxylase PuuD [Rhodospirillaceae bacterium]MBT7266915.1 urate hydroxylase PuuD [Rhodospirillaceae bacterium]
MDIAYAEWLELMFRWLHLIAGIAWIGSSFYFMFLDYSLRPEEGLPEGVKGASWNVHGGGFYFMQKYTVAPPKMPDVLHWFKWEAYFTWISGFSLMVIIYYWGAESFLIDREVMDLNQWQAIGISIGAFIAGWVIYDQVCKSPLGKSEIALSAIVFVMILLAAYGFTHVYSGRGAFVHVGAMVGTIMVANVFFVIIPNQRIVVDALIAGDEPDPQLGEDGKQRSTHNNYLTLPVLLMMISSHFPMIFSNQHSWVVVGLVIIIGGIIRDYYNAKNQGKSGSRLKWQWATAAAFMAVLMVFISYREDVKVAEDDQLEATDVLAIVQTRCVSCHAAKPTDEDIEEAPGGVKLETLADIKKYSAVILKQAVLTNAMPLGNKTKMTKKERQGMGDWIKRGMPAEE